MSRGIPRAGVSIGKEKRRNMRDTIVVKIVLPAESKPWLGSRKGTNSAQRLSLGGEATRGERKRGPR
jgi:hypothetical protein